jgi:hypothetical protein
MGKISPEQLRKAYIASAKRVFYGEVQAMERTRVHEIAIKLGITAKEVEVIWNEAPKH